MEIIKTKFNKVPYQVRDDSSHNHYAQSVSGYTTVLDEETEEELLVVLPLEDDVSGTLNGAIESIRLNVLPIKGQTLGDVVEHRQFGWMRDDGFNPPQANFCRFPETTQYNELCFLASKFEQMYKTFAPKSYAHHEEAKKINSIYRLSETVFSNGVINFDPSCKYHYDQGNFENAMTVVYLEAKDAVGSGLVFPQLNLAVRGDNCKMLVCFNGGKLIHAPTPWRKGNEAAYRFSIVFYTLANLIGILNQEHGGQQQVK